MRRALRESVCYVLAAWILVGFSVLPNSVLCVAPGNHVAIEVVGELCCEKHLPDPHGPAAQSRDNCTDVFLGISAQRADSSRLLLGPAGTCWRSPISLTALGSEQSISSAERSAWPAKTGPPVILRLLI